MSFVSEIISPTSSTHGQFGLHCRQDKPYVLDRSPKDGGMEDVGANRILTSDGYLYAASVVRMDQ